MSLTNLYDRLIDITHDIHLLDSNSEKRQFVVSTLKGIHHEIDIPKFRESLERTILLTENEYLSLMDTTCQIHYLADELNEYNVSRY
jgi:hypothetical protein